MLVICRPPRGRSWLATLGTLHGAEVIQTNEDEQILAPARAMSDGRDDHVSAMRRLARGGRPPALRIRWASPGKAARQPGRPLPLEIEDGPDRKRNGGQARSGRTGRPAARRTIRLRSRTRCAAPRPGHSGWSHLVERIWCVFIRLDDRYSQSGDFALRTPDVRTAGSTRAWYSRCARRHRDHAIGIEREIPPVADNAWPRRDTGTGNACPNAAAH